ncbi:MAG: hypothetical protein ACJASV_001141 [Pseudorhodobacter sp.]
MFLQGLFDAEGGVALVETDQAAVRNGNSVRIWTRASW